MIEGEPPANGLSAVAGDRDDGLLDLARRLAEQSAADDEALEGLFARHRVIDSDGDDVLNPISDDDADCLWDFGVPGNESPSALHV